MEGPQRGINLKKEDHTDITWLIIIRTSGFLEDLQADPREVLMEGSQGEGYAAPARMQHLSAEQGRAHPSSRVTSATTNSGTEVGKYLHGLHYRVTQGPRARLLICRGWSTDQICPFLCYLIRLLRSPGSRVIFQRGLQVTRVTQDHCQWSGQ